MKQNASRPKVFLSAVGQLLGAKVRVSSALLIYLSIFAILLGFGLKRHWDLVGKLKFKIQEHEAALKIQQHEAALLSLIYGGVFVEGNHLIKDYKSEQFCRKKIYDGAQSLLYTDRPYHTETDLLPLVGTYYCTTVRHSTSFSFVRIVEPTTFYVIGTNGLGLESQGWEEVDISVLVRAGGQSFNMLFQRSIGPGFYFINHAFNSSTLPVFFRHSQ